MGKLNVYPVDRINFKHNGIEVGVVTEVVKSPFDGTECNKCSIVYISGVPNETRIIMKDTIQKEPLYYLLRFTHKRVPVKHTEMVRGIYRKQGDKYIPLLARSEIS